MEFLYFPLNFLVNLKLLSKEILEKNFKDFLKNIMCIIQEGIFVPIK